FSFLVPHSGTRPFGIPPEEGPDRATWSRSSRLSFPLSGVLLSRAAQRHAALRHSPGGGPGSCHLEPELAPLLSPFWCSPFSCRTAARGPSAFPRRRARIVPLGAGARASPFPFLVFSFLVPHSGTRPFGIPPEEGPDRATWSRSSRLSFPLSSVLL